VLLFEGSSVNAKLFHPEHLVPSHGVFDVRFADDVVLKVRRSFEIPNSQSFPLAAPPAVVENHFEAKTLFPEER
jgi:hypothetical protein